MVATIDVGGREVGAGRPCLVIAEAGVNHNGDPALAGRLVEAAADAGADAVKFQTFSADDVAAAEAPKAAYQERDAGTAESQREMLRRLELAPEAHAALAAQAQELDLLFLSSPFDEASVDLLVELGVPALKLGSGELTDLPFLAYCARTGLPLIVSTGLADLEEVREAMAAIAEAGGRRVILLHCVSAYPAPPEEQNLRAMRTLEEEFGFPVGFSDHTTGTTAAVAAVALGAAVLEKHFTLDRGLPGPDHAASLEPAELAELVRSVRETEAALGDGVKRPSPSELPNRVPVRRSLAARRDLVAGTVLDESMITALRPATGIPPARLAEVVGLRLGRDVRRGELLKASDLA